MSRFDTIMVAEIGVVVAVLGITLAALALTMGSASIGFLDFLEQQGEGLLEDFWPFWLTMAFAAITAIGGTLALGFVGADPATVADWSVRLAIAGVTFFFVWTLVSALQIVSVVHRYLRARVKYTRAVRQAADDGRAHGSNEEGQ